VSKHSGFDCTHVLTAQPSNRIKEKKNESELKNTAWSNYIPASFIATSIRLKAICKYLAKGVVAPNLISRKLWLKFHAMCSLM
jgi:hypothetical protein